jgi:general nucleoside transport system ATP-binding protein
MSQYRLELNGITKSYPGVVANNDVSLRVKAGEIHAVLGENGAGKSTLMKIIYGSVKPDAGAISFNSQIVQIRNPQQARSLGISMVFQHFSLFDTLSVAENVWLGLEKRQTLSEVQRRISDKASEYGLDIDPMRPVHTLSVGEMQRVEIIRALLSDPQLLILDEPTSVLTPQAVEKLFVVLRQLAAQGCSILYISHKLHEIRELCTACTVLRGGKVTGECDPRQQSNADLSHLMIGALPQELTHREQTPGALAFQICDLNLQSDEPFGTDLKHIDLQVRSGEIVGIAGVSGNGQRELLHVLSGEDTRAAAKSVALLGKSVGQDSPQKRRQEGLYFVPEERLGRGAVPVLSLAENLLLTRYESVASQGVAGVLGWLHIGQLHEQAQSIISKYQVKTAGTHAQAKSLSGGNLQKFLVGREIEAAPKVLIVSQPTWGVDVGAAAQIRSALLALRDAGCAVLLISEELEELLELSDRLYVIANGRLSPSLARSQADISLIGEWMSGLWPTQGEQHVAA